MAVCPFCRKHIPTSINIAKSINADTDTDTLKKVLIGKANFITCPQCSENFYYEHTCGIFSADKKYAVVCLAGADESILPKEKSAIFKILKMDDFKLRYVNEFIQLIEKARILESDLDDRVLEIIKYKYIVLPKNLDTKAKVILTNVNSASMIFTIFDDYDKPLLTHPVNLEVYSKENNLQKETLHGCFNQWNRIDTLWASLTHSKDGLN